MTASPTILGKAMDPEPSTTVPGFFGTMRRTPDLTDLGSSALSSGRFPHIPQPLLDRVGSLDPQALLAKSTRRDAESFEHRFLQRISLGPSLTDLERIETLGPRQLLEEQLDPQGIDDFGLEELLEDALPTLTMTPFERLVNYNEDPQVPVFEFWVANIFRAIYTPRQLLERMVVFWTDHFNVPVLSDLGIWLKPTDERQVIRAHALGRFPDLLRASAHSAAMLSYLTNDSNVKGHPNENYARELMELHSLGVDGGYSEQDVKEVARCLTGWTFRPYQAGPAFGDFFFAAGEHDNDAKTVLGHAIPAGGGIVDGDTVLDILANHPSTARFISQKMLRYFWGYEPSERAVERIAGIYQATGGDIKEMLRGILSWGQLASATPKLKRPYHLVVSAMRALFAQVENPFVLLAALDQAGHVPYTWAPPNGFPDSAGYWSGFVLPRWNFATMAASAGDDNIRLDLPFLTEAESPEELRALLDLLLLNGTMSTETSTAVLAFLDARPMNVPTVREAIALVIASPEFQNY
ncbi:MAG: DUF1800 domain-containing protein [Acidobacteriota bacterium]